MKWDLLTQEQLERLGECRSRRSDIVPIAKCYKVERGVSAELALELTLEHLGANNQFVDLTDEEYKRFIKEVEQ